MNRYDQFTTTMGNQEGIDKLNSAFDEAVGHDHNGSGQGKPIKPFIISAIAPSDTTKLWIDNNGVAYFYNGTTWISIKGTFLD